MCVCTPEMKTPFCGKPGCEWPEQIPPRPAGAIVVDIPTDTSVAIYAARATRAQRPIIVKVGHFGVKIEVPQQDWLIAFTDFDFHEGAD